MLLPIQQRRVTLPNGRVVNVFAGVPSAGGGVSGLSGAPRKTCLDCTRKHVSQAAVLMEEALQGYPDHRWLAVGHLAEASAECLDQYPALAKELRDHRVAYMADPNYKVPVVALLNKASALAGGSGVGGLGDATAPNGNGSSSPGEISLPRVPRGPKPPAPLFMKLQDGPQPYDMTWGPPVQYVKIPGGEWGTVATLKVMKELVLGKWGHRNPEVVLLAKKIVADVSPGPAKDYEAMAAAILDFMKSRVKYELDPSGLEYVQTPHYTLLNSGSGDCDDHATATAALAMALGFRAAFRTVKGDRDRQDQWSHVYPVIGITSGKDDVWLTADSTQKESFVGWDPPEGKLYGMKTWVIDPQTAEGVQWDS